VSPPRADAARATRGGPLLLSHVLPDYRVEVKGATKALELDVSTGVEAEIAGILGEFLPRRGNQIFATAGLSGGPRSNYHGFPIEIAPLLNRFFRVDSRLRHESRLWMFDTLG
jgi:hypothetical protein